jgi:hypothetical protein
MSGQSQVYMTGRSVEKTSHLDEVESLPAAIAGNAPSRVGFNPRLPLPVRRRT